MLNRTYGKSLLTNLWEISEEGLDIVLCLVRANSVHYSGLWIVLPLPEIANVKGLNKVGLMRRELDNPDTVHLSLKDEVGCLMARSSIY